MYKRERRTVRLVFDDPEYNGLEVVTRSVPLGAYMRMVTLAAKAGNGFDVKDAESMNELFVDFAEHALIEWNLADDDDQPVPTTLAGIQSQDVDFMMHIIMTWLGAIGAAQAPLVPSSNDGSTSDFLSSSPSN